MPAEQKKVLLLGGTGAMGVYLAPELLRLGHRVDITSRGDHVSSERDLHYIKGNAKDLAFVTPLLANGGYDAVVDFMIYRTAEFQQRYEMLLNHAPHYLFLSSYRVYGDNGRPITEQSPRLLDTVRDQEYLATDEYALAKARQENLLTGAPRRNWTILRPAITYSTTRFQLGTMEASEFLRRMLTGKTVPFPREMLDKQTTLSWAGDVARMIAKLVSNEQAFGETFTLATAEHHSWREVIELYKSILGGKVQIVDLKTYSEILGRPWQIKYDRMYNRVIDNSKALAATGLTQASLMPLCDGLRIELADFSRFPRYGKVDETVQQKMDLATRQKPDNGLRQRVRRLLKRAYKSRKNVTVAYTAKLAVKLVKKILRWGWRQAKKVLRHLRAVGVKDRITINKKWETACIVTVQGYENYGCILQNYALQETLRKWFNVYTLDVEPQYPFSRLIKDTHHLNLYHAQKNQHQFIEKHIPHHPSLNKANLVVVGSDQVWHPFFNTRGRFWAKNFAGRRKISYAASFGDKSNADLSDVYKQAIAYFAPKFYAISVREPEGKQIIEANTSKQCEVVCDPVLLQDRGFYEGIIGARPKPGKSWFGYMIKDEGLEGAVDDLARATGRAFHNYNMYRQVIKDQDRLKSVLLKVEYPTVETWLKQLRDSEMVFTSSFHAVALSLILHKDFVYLKVDGRIDGRIHELLRATGTTNRAVDDVGEQTLGSVGVIDWSEVDERMAQYRSKSLQWLEKNLRKS